MRNAARENPDRIWSEIAVILLDDAGMRPVNHQLMGREDVTDVISCLYEPVPGEEGYSADIFVNIELAGRRGRRRRPPEWSVSRELALYIAHGLNHLTGADDGTPRERARMRRREMRWLTDAASACLDKDLVMDVDSSAENAHAEPSHS